MRRLCILPPLRVIALSLLLLSSIGHGLADSTPIKPNVEVYDPLNNFTLESTNVSVSDPHLDWDSRNASDEHERLIPYGLTFAVLGLRFDAEVDGNAVISFAYFGNDSTVDLIPPSSVALINGSHHFSFALGPCKTLAMRNSSQNVVWERFIVSYGNNGQAPPNGLPFTLVTGKTFRYYEDASIRLNRLQYIYFPVPHTSRLYVLSVQQSDFKSANPSEPVRSFTLKLNITRYNSNAPGISTIFERVVVTSKEQCPEINEDLTKSGTYETWFIPTVDNTSFVHEFQTNIFFNFKYTNSTEVFVGVFLRDVNSSSLASLNSSYAMSIDFSSFQTALPFESLSTGAIVIAAVLGAVVIALVVAVIVWSKKSNHSYEILYT